MPFALTLAGNERNGITEAKHLIENLFPDYVIAEKAYDADKLFCCGRKETPKQCFRQSLIANGNEKLTSIYTKTSFD